MQYLQTVVKAPSVADAWNGLKNQCNTIKSPTLIYQMKQKLQEIKWVSGDNMSKFIDCFRTCYNYDHPEASQTWLSQTKLVFLSSRLQDSPYTSVSPCFRPTSLSNLATFGLAFIMFDLTSFYLGYFRISTQLIPLVPCIWPQNSGTTVFVDTPAFSHSFLDQTLVPQWSKLLNIGSWWFIAIPIPLLFLSYDLICLIPLHIPSHPCDFMPYTLLPFIPILQTNIYNILLHV